MPNLNLGTVPKLRHLSPIVFVLCGLTKGDWLDALLFSISVAAGITPQMLPVIVTTCLARGADAMRASDCYISVDTAVDVAKESADTILLKKDLIVLARGIVEGHRIYGNTIKYIKTTASSNSDILIFAAMLWVVCPLVAGAPWDALTDPAQRALFALVFQTGWFVESMWTQTLVIHLLRTERLPFVQSKPAASLTALTVLGVGLVTAMPYVPGVNAALGLAPLPGAFFVVLAVMMIGYLLLTSIAKAPYVRAHGEILQEDPLAETLRNRVSRREGEVFRIVFSFFEIYRRP